MLLGVWSPGSEPPPPPKEPSPGQKEPAKDTGIPPVWTPSSAGTSPVPEKKEFRPVQFESPILSRKKPAQQEVSYQETYATIHFVRPQNLTRFNSLVSTPLKIRNVIVR